MKRIDFVIELIKDRLGVETDKEMCAALEIPYSSLEVWKEKGEIPRQAILSITARLDEAPNEFLNTDDERKRREEKRVKFVNNRDSVIINGNNSGDIANVVHAQSEKKRDVNIDLYPVKEYLIYGEDVESRFWDWIFTPKTAASELLEMCDIYVCEDDILEAEFIQKDRNDAVGLRVKICEGKITARRDPKTQRIVIEEEY